MARVLVVGGAGYVGGAVTDKLQELQHSVRVYDALVYEESYRKPVDFVYGDVRDEERLTAQLRWADVVVWLAAIVGDGACGLNSKLTAEINEQSVRRMAERFDGRIILTSTCSVYGANKDLLHEQSPVNPLSLYAQTKLQAEKHLAEKEAVIFRLGTLFGVGDAFSRIRMDLVLNVLTAKAFAYNRISVFGGNQYRPLLHVRDAAEMIASQIDTPHCGIFNLHSANIRICDLAEQLLAHFPRLQVQNTEARFQDERDYKVCSDKAARTLGFAPKYSVEEGIREVKGLLEAGRVKSIAFLRQSNHRYLREFLEMPSSPLGCELPLPV